MTILIIEDDAGISELLKDKLEECGHETVDVQSAGEALAWLENHSPYLMLLDYGLPDMNGKELIEVLKQKERPLPDFIVSTGQGDERIAVDMMKLGARDYIVKDAHFLDMLPEVVRRVDQEIENENELKRAEEALQESERRHRIIFENSPLGMIRFDSEGTMVDFNDKFIELMGASRKKLIGFNTARQSTPEMRHAIKKALAGQVAVFENQYTSVTGGKTRYLRVVFNPINPGKSPTQVIATLEDITERKRAEEEKEKLEAQNRLLQKSEGLGRMAGAIAHNFNNLLQTVTGNLEMAIEDLPQDAGPLKNLAEAMQAARRAADMSGLMLTYIGQSAAKRKPVDLADSCRKSLPELRSAMPQCINLETVFPAPGPVVNANTAQLQQILAHLATNAWEAAAQGRSSIRMTVGTIASADIPDSGRFPPDWRPQDNAHAYLKVADKGHGIKYEDIDKIFDPFFTDKFTGRGLGLAVVLGIVKALDGGVTVTSAPDQGSVFQVFLPLSSQSVTRPGYISKMPGLEGGGLILVADDQEGVRNVAKAMLERIGFQSLTAKDGTEAVEIFREKQADISLVISDLSMPNMNGWETLAALRRIRPDIPVILSSGYDEAQAMNGKHSEQPQAFLAKPYKMKTLKDALANVLAKVKHEV